MRARVLTLATLRELANQCSIHVLSLQLAARLQCQHRGAGGLGLTLMLTTALSIDLEGGTALKSTVVNLFTTVWLMLTGTAFAATKPADSCPRWTFCH